MSEESKNPTPAATIEEGCNLFLLLDTLDIEGKKEL